MSTATFSTRSCPTWWRTTGGPAAFLVYLCLWRKTRGGARSAVISLSMLSDATGLSKRGAQTALQHLERRALGSTRRASVTSAPSVTLHAHWRK